MVIAATLAPCTCGNATCWLLSGVAQPHQTQGELEVEGARRVAPTVAQELTDPVESLGDRVGVQVEGRRRLLEPPAAGEPRLERVDEPGPPARIPLAHRADHRLDEGRHVLGIVV